MTIQMRKLNSWAVSYEIDNNLPKYHERHYGFTLPISKSRELLDKLFDEAYDRVAEDALLNGVPHIDGCSYKDRSIPTNECPCNCYKRWWFRRAWEAGKK